MTPRTTFANGINPFQGLGAIPSTKPREIMQKPARKNATLIKDEDYSTPYKPPAVVSEQMKKKMIYIDPKDIQITDDELPASRCVPLNKYNNVFGKMRLGQSLRCTTENIGKVSNAMRKYVELNGMKKKAVVRTVTKYTDPKTKIEDVGYGRVWMLAAPSVG